ncbi:helix-turn-helix domain-containing protein [Stenotrophomonas maltophilia]|uniref:helix-turn-helix domain-containing protein n=1 Tax=Stenotrophomonas maltophilia TaxID=40324 RepID=UPI002B1E5AB8|nr:helix-turn-helix domain-containing protein [Stenotrophomonas maltophilia]
MSTEQQPIAYSINDAAKAIGISRAGLYNLLGDKKIAGRKIGARTVIPADELRRFVNSQPMYEPGEGVH